MPGPAPSQAASPSPCPPMHRCRGGPRWLLGSASPARGRAGALARSAAPPGFGGTRL